MAASAAGATRSLLVVVTLLIAVAGAPSSSSSLLRIAAAAATPLNAAAAHGGVTLRVDRRQVRPRPAGQRITVYIYCPYIHIHWGFFLISTIPIYLCKG
jgi:hypothetical protein